MEHVDVGGVTRVPAEFPAETPVMPDDGYPKIILDQREQYGSVTSVAEVRAYQDRYLAEHQLARHTNPDHPTVVPYISKSRWVADCPECGRGLACWDENPAQTCLGCGAQYEAVWQPPTERSQAIRLLAARPVEHRDWFPHKGESVHRLAVENQLLFNAGVVVQNGLDVPEGVTAPDEFISPWEYLEHLRTVEHKRHHGHEVSERG